MTLPSFTAEIKDINRGKAVVTIKPSKAYMSELANRVKPYTNLPSYFRPALEAVGDYVRTSMIPRVFEEEGPGWRKLARRTVNERLALGYTGQHPILRRSGDLFKELTEKSHPAHVERIYTGKHSRIEIGGSSIKFIENQKGMPQMRLPARPMIPGTGNIPFSGADRRRLTDIVQDSLKKSMEKSNV